jgi:hypothetical protein
MEKLALKRCEYCMSIYEGASCSNVRCPPRGRTLVRSKRIQMVDKDKLPKPPAERPKISLRDEDNLVKSEDRSHIGSQPSVAPSVVRSYQVKYKKPSTTPNVLVPYIERNEFNTTVSGVTVLHEDETRNGLYVLDQMCEILIVDLKPRCDSLGFNILLPSHHVKCKILTLKNISCHSVYFKSRDGLINSRVYDRVIIFPGESVQLVHVEGLGWITL